MDAGYAILLIVLFCLAIGWLFAKSSVARREQRSDGHGDGGSTALSSQGCDASVGADCGGDGGGGGGGD